MEGIKTLLSKTPTSAHNYLCKHSELLYMYTDDCKTYKGFKAKPLGIDGVAEIILVNGKSIQVRILKEVPYDSSMIKFGDF